MRFVLAAILIASATGARAEIGCPDSLEVDQRATAPSNEWAVSYIEPPLRLVGVAVFDGPPSQNHKVKPFSTKSTAGELRVSWRLPESRRNFHLMCSYEHTSASLTTVLPPRVKGCNAVFDRRVFYGQEGMAVKRIVCG